MLRKVALWSVTLNVPSEGGRELLLVPPPQPPRPLPVPPHQAFLWQHHASFMPSIFRIIPNLIAVSLLLPAAAAPKIKSRPTKGMLGWSLLIDQMLCCSKNSSHQAIRSIKTAADMQMLNFKYDYIDWAAEASLDLHIWTRSKSRFTPMETWCSCVWAWARAWMSST